MELSLVGLFAVGVLLFLYFIVVGIGKVQEEIAMTNIQLGVIRKHMGAKRWDNEFEK